MINFSKNEDYTSANYRALGKELLHTAYFVNKNLGDRGFEKVESDKDLVLVADLEISRNIKEIARKSGIEATLFTEEFGEDKLSQTTRAVIGFDDVDGTFNKHDGKGILPYCSIVSIFDSPNPIHLDTTYAGIIIHNTGDVVEAVRGQGVFMNGNPIKPLKTKLDDETRLYISIYETSRKDPETLVKLVQLMARTRCPGELLSAGVSFAMIPIHGGAYISAACKEHELGAGYLLARECGGVAVDFDGVDIGLRKFDFNVKVPVIAASSDEIAQEIIKELRR